MCLDACKRNFQVCRSIIGVYGCFLNGNFGGKIIAAIGKNPNGQIRPIVLVVVELVP